MRSALSLPSALSTSGVLLVALVLALAQASCATGLFARTPRSREQAIRTCASDVPADAVPYADAFSACMEERGFVYTGTTGPRD